MRRLLTLAAAVLALAPLVAAGRGADTPPMSDPAGDERVALALPAGVPTGSLSCHDPSIDILSLSAATHGKTLLVEVLHAASVRTPLLACDGRPVPVAGQSYGISVGGNGDSYLFLSVDAAEACLYVLFENPVQVSECIPAAQVDGATIRLEVGLRGVVAVEEGVTRPYKLSGTLSIHAFNREDGVPLPGRSLPLAPDALLRVEDHSDTALLHLGG